jgi:hypothetical protein
MHRRVWTAHLFVPSHSLALQELFEARDSSEATKATALPSTVGQNGLVVYR